MPANIETMAYARAGGVPWHGLGRAVDGARDSEAMIEAAGLAWSVKSVRLWAGPIAPVPGAEGTYPAQVEVPDYRAIRRSDTGAVLGVVGDGYQPLQNGDAFAFLDGLAQDRTIQYQTAGALGGGRRVWALAEVPDGAMTIAGDSFQTYMLITTGHDGAHAVNIQSTSVRVVCQNTLNAALAGRSAQSFRFVHTRSLPERMAAASNALQFVSEQQRRLATFLERAAATDVERATYCELEDQLFGTEAERGPRVRNNLGRFRSVVGAEVARGGRTAYALVNGITGYADHARTMNLSTIAKREARLESTIDGGAATFKAQGLAFVRQLVSA